MAHVVALVRDELGAAFARSAEAAAHDLDVCTGEVETWDACEERTELIARLLGAG